MNYNKQWGMLFQFGALENNDVGVGCGSMFRITTYLQTENRLQTNYFLYILEFKSEEKKKFFVIDGQLNFQREWFTNPISYEYCDSNQEEWLKRFLFGENTLRRDSLISIEYNEEAAMKVAIQHLKTVSNEINKKVLEKFSELYGFNKDDYFVALFKSNEMETFFKGKSIKQRGLVSSFGLNTTFNKDFSETNPLTAVIFSLKSGNKILANYNYFEEDINWENPVITCKFHDLTELKSIDFFIKKHERLDLMIKNIKFLKGKKNGIQKT